jgi:putative endonuclease
MKGYRQEIGAWGENYAAEYLEARGYQVLERNYRTPYGEIDLIVSKDSVVIFVEVKTRSTTAFGLPEGGVTSKKQAHLVGAAQSYIQDHPQYENGWRVDVIAVLGRPGASTPELTHFENAIH